jgi:hypothetical protein
MVLLAFKLEPLDWLEQHVSYGCFHLNTSITFEQIAAA